MKGSPGMKQQLDNDYDSESSSDNSAETEYEDNREDVLKSDLVVSGSPGSISFIGSSVSRKPMHEVIADTFIKLDTHSTWHSYMIVFTQ